MAVISPAAIFAALLGAESVTIWTDVDGVFSGDPRRVPDAAVIPELSYQDAAELAYFGAKVIHPNTMSPVITNDIAVWIKTVSSLSSGHKNFSCFAKGCVDKRPCGS